MSDSPSDTSSDVPEPEPRVKALVRGEVREDELDPVTIAQLAAWFGAPASGVVVPQTADAADEDDSLWRERRERERHVEASVDHKLMAKLHAWIEKSDGLTHLPPPMTLGIEREMSRLDMSVWRVRSVETVERERPEDIADGLKEPVPQAVLRDLHRPVMNWRYLLLEQSLGMDVGGMQSIERIRETTHTPYRVRMEQELIASQLVYRDMRDLANQLEEPWDEIEIPEENRSTSSLGRTPEDILWFGAIGFDPTI